MAGKVTDKELQLTEQSSFADAIAGQGQYGVLNETPNVPVFQDDAGNVKRLITTLGTVVDTSTGATSYTITGIPSGVKEVKVMFFGVSTAGASPGIVQLGDAGGIEATGYDANVVDISTTVGKLNSTVGFPTTNTGAAALILSGTLTLSLQDASTNTWIATFNGAHTAGTDMYVGAGEKSLSAELTQIKLTTTGGSTTFDAGSINIQF